jgi:hypothetical protein
MNSAGCEPPPCSTCRLGFTSPIPPAERFLKQIASLPGYYLETMKRLVKRINPAFTVVQPLPLWPVTITPPTSFPAGDRQSAAPQPAVLPETLPVTLCALPARNDYSRSTAAN